MREVLEEMERDLKDERVELLKAYLELMWSCVKGADRTIALAEKLSKGLAEPN